MYTHIPALRPSGARKRSPTETVLGRQSESILEAYKSTETKILRSCPMSAMMLLEERLRLGAIVKGTAFTSVLRLDQHR